MRAPAVGALGRLSDRAVFGACLAGLVAGIGLFLVLPLAPKFLELHRLPTIHRLHPDVGVAGLIRGVGDGPAVQ